LKYGVRGDNLIGSYIELSFFETGRKMASMVGTKTFGEKPSKFQIEEGGDYYYVGSEVCPYLFTLIFF